MHKHTSTYHENRVINYIDADALLTSAFHPNYIDKMIQCGASQHFSHVFVVSGGIEGGLAFPVGRRSGITLTSWSQDESQNEVLNSQKVTPSDILSDEIRSQVQYENSPSWLACNAELISRCWDRPGSGNEAFDTVVNATREALDYSLQSKLLQISSHRIVSKPG